MNKILKKVLSIILIVTLLIVEYPYINSVDAKVVTSNIYSNSNTWYENGGNEYFSDKQYKDAKDAGLLPTLPSGNVYPQNITRKVGTVTTTYTLNYRLFKQKNLFVYGSYLSLGSNNYYKCGYQTHTNLTNLQPDISYQGGYFKKPTGDVCHGIEQNDSHPTSCAPRGEWKYLGYDVNGNAFSNMWMINVATVTGFSQRNWQPEPWKAPLSTSTGLAKASEYNEVAYGGGDLKTAIVLGTRNWINKTIPLTDGQSRISTKTDTKGFSTEPYKFLYIQSPPTTHQAGSAKMWHKLASNGQLWYQTFSVPVLAGKEFLPVECTVKATPVDGKLPYGNVKDSQPITLEFSVTGILRDDIDEITKEPFAYYNDAASRTVKYTRKDLASWNLTLSVPSLEPESLAVPHKTNVIHTSDNTNKATGKILIKTTVGKLKELPKEGKAYVVNVTSTATPIYDKEKLSPKFGSGNGKVLIEEEEPIKIVTPPALTLNIENHIGEIAFDDVSFDDVSDNTDLSDVANKKVTVNGQVVDYSTFFSQSYVFPATTDKNGYFASVIVTYIMKDGKEYSSLDYVYVYPTKPNAQYLISSNTWKQNRIINVTNNSASGNIQLVIDKYPITEYRWTYSGDASSIHKGTDTDFQKQLQYSEPGSYSLTLECKNSLGKWSDPYTVEYQVFEDYAPNIELNLSDSVLTRTDELSAWHYDVNSTDGDKVAIAKIELWYDSDNDRTTDTKVQEWNGFGDNAICEIDDFPKYTATELGYYKYKVFAKEEFIGVAGQDTLTQFITDADKKEKNYEVEFWVDNYQPLSDLYVDAAIDRPSVDLFIMRDKNLEEAKMTYISDNRVSMENWLLGRNILPSVNIWNMKTYEYSTPASTSSTTGTSYPPSSVPYSSSGYSGTLNRTSVSDNGSTYDFGYTAYKTESKYCTGTGNGYSYTNYRFTVTNTKTGAGSWSVTGSSQTNNSSIYYSSDGYSGYIGGLSNTSVSSDNGPPSGTASNGSTYTRTIVYLANYGGTLTKTVSYWVPDMRWVSNYTGFYSGTIYKYVRQPYTNPWRANSSKYILYISDSNIAELPDLNSVQAQCDAKVILAGASTIQLQSACDKYIDTTGKSAQEIMDEALEYIGQETPSIEQFYVLPNQEFTLNYGEEDLENDTIVSREMQYVHDKDYFDNPTGQEPNTQTNYSAVGGWGTTIRNSFSNTGKYQIYRRVKDSPTGAYGDDYSYYSGSTEVDIYVHRKPRALASLDWDFDSGTNTYKTAWVDQSYDLDHNISRSDTDKGIAERKIMWRKDAGDWNYTIPNNLSPGTYNLRYYVKDIENSWSDVFTINIDGHINSNVTEVTFTLTASPPMQFEAKLRAEKQKFRTPETPVTLPASENLELFGLWTRYPSNPILTMALYKENGTQAGTTKTVNLTNDTGKKLSNDITWNNILYNTSSTLPDGNYIFKITANAQQNKTISFPVTINTPINLIANINGKEDNAQINTGEVNIFTLTTSIYVNSTQLIFEGSTYNSDQNQIKLILNDGINKTWRCSIDVGEGAYPDGKLGTATFMATLPSGRYERAYVNYKVVGIRATNFLITMMLDIGWRDYYFDIGRGIDDNHDGINDRYPRRSNTDIGTLKLPINYYSLIGHSRAYIKAGYKVKGKIDIQGNPDLAYFKVSYKIDGSSHIDNIFLTKSAGNTYVFEWIIPLESESKSFICFDLVTTKGTNTYGNEKWVDQWDSRNKNQEVFYVKGNALDDLTFVQSH